LKIKAAVRERDGYRCTECSMTGSQHRRRYDQDLEVHRIHPGSIYALELCVTLCRKCHKKKPKKAAPVPGIPMLGIRQLNIEVSKDEYYILRLAASFRGFTVPQYVMEIALNDARTYAAKLAAHNPEAEKNFDEPDFCG